MCVSVCVYILNVLLLFFSFREKEREENPEAEFSETWLFFGCRHRDRDFLFR